jgi:excisionase family DNA binding protein
MFEPLALSPRDAAAMLAVSKRTVSRLIRTNKITARKHGKRTLVDVESVKAFYSGLPLKATHMPLVFGRRPGKKCIPRLADATKLV